jgi:hypothetical protein
MSDDLVKNINLLPSQYGSILDPTLVATDYMYGLSELFAFQVSMNICYEYKFKMTCFSRQKNGTPHHKPQTQQNASL